MKNIHNLLAFSFVFSLGITSNDLYSGHACCNSTSEEDESINRLSYVNEEKKNEHIDYDKKQIFMASLCTGVISGLTFSVADSLFGPGWKPLAFIVAFIINIPVYDNLICDENVRSDYRVFSGPIALSAIGLTILAINFCKDQSIQAMQ